MSDLREEKKRRRRIIATLGLRDGPAEKLNIFVPIGNAGEARRKTALAARWQQINERAASEIIATGRRIEEEHIRSAADLCKFGTRNQDEQMGSVRSLPLQADDGSETN